MKFKIKKSYYRLFSVFLSLVMIVLSVPISAVAQEPESTDLSLSENSAAIVFPESYLSTTTEKEQEAEAAKIALSATANNSQNAELLAAPPVTTDTLPEGVYAIRNVGNPTMYLDTWGDSPLPDRYMQQFEYPTNPAQTRYPNLAKGGLFKLEQYGTTNRYIIRLMTNNELTLGYSGNNVTTRNISTDQSEITYSETFLIEEKTPGKFYIRPNANSYVLAAPNSTASGGYTEESRLTRMLKSQSNDLALWEFCRYDGPANHTVELVTYPTKMITGQTTMIWGYTSSTTVGINGPIEYSVTATNFSATNKASVDIYSGELSAIDVGNVYVWATCKETPYEDCKTVSIEKSLEGNYHFQNRATCGFMQPDNNDEHFMEQHNESGSGKQNWIVEHYSDGYYTIQNVDSRLFLTSPASTSSGTKILEASLNANSINRQIWKFSETSDGYFKIQSKAMEPNSMALSLGTTLSLGANICQKSYTNDTNYTDEWNLITANDKAIVIVPGIACSHLQTFSGSHIWLDLSNVGNLGSIACNENGESIRDDIVIYNPDNYGITDMYELLYDSLKSTYIEEYDIIFFAYDWRMSCAAATDELETILTNYDDNIIVAHSMGGLVASSYLDKSSTNRNKTDKFISIGTPYTGAPKALYVMETGRLNVITEAAFHLKGYVSNMPAVYELLPSKNYFNHYTSFINSNGTNWEGFDDSLAYMQMLDWAKKANGTVKPMFDSAITFHDSLINVDKHITDHINVDAYKIVGTGQSTIYKINYDGANYMDCLEFTEGDGTVPLYSATNNGAPTASNVYTIDNNHTAILSDSRCINQVISIINGTNTTNNNTLTSSASASLVSTDSNSKITIVTKNIESMIVTNGLGYEIFIRGQDVCYKDDTGTVHKIGSVWYLKENSYQYLLENDEYSISNIVSTDSFSTVRIDYSDTGLTKNAISIGGIYITDRVLIPKSSAEKMKTSPQDIIITKGALPE